MPENGKSSSPSSSRRPTLRVDPAGRRHERLVLEEPLALTLWKVDVGELTLDGERHHHLQARVFERDLPAGAIVWIRFPDDRGDWIPERGLNYEVARELRAWAAEMREGPIWKRGVPELLIARAERLEAE